MADAQADLSLHWAHIPFCLFYHEAAHVDTRISAPQWATEIIEDIKSIKQSVAKIDEIETFVNKINLKVEILKLKVIEMIPNVTDVEKSRDFTSEEYEDTKDKFKSSNEDIKRLRKSARTLKKTLETQNQTIETKTDDLEERRMRENLLFLGIPEANIENCEMLVKQLV